MNRKLSAVAGLALLLAPALLPAQSWTKWSYLGLGGGGAPDTVRGTLQFGSQTVNATWTGRSYFVNLANAGTNYWVPQAAFSTGSVTGPSTSDIIALYTATHNTLTFDTPVNNLFMALNSLGQGGLPVTYAFDQNFSIVKDNSVGPCPYWGCGSLGGGGTSLLTGVEGSGIIQFSGDVSTLTWDSSAEGWHGFTVGAADIGTTVPEPSTWMLMGTGLLAVGGVVRRRK
jgi:hypothetical protein